jgi:hypothetical protein
MSLYYIFNPHKTKLGILYNAYYTSIERNINVTKDNMDEITISNDDSNWSELKEINTDDKQLKKTYNLLVEDITKCYLITTDLKNKVYDNKKVLSFKNKTSISEKDLLKLSENENCLKEFDKYNSLTLSDDAETSEKIRKQISIIVDYGYGTSNDGTFQSVIEEEAITVSKIANLSKWLKIEYNSNK